MSFSTFAHDLLSPAKTRVSLDSQRTYAAASTRLSIFRRDHPLARTVYRLVVNVTNTGPMPGATSLLGFVHPPNGAGTRAPIRSLFAFEKVHLAVGQSAQVALAVTEHDLTVTKEHGGRRAVEGEWLLTVGNEAAARATLAVVAEAEGRE